MAYGGGAPSRKGTRPTSAPLATLTITRVLEVTVLV
jgi:hypothetical protein